MKFDIYAPESLSDITLEQYMKFYKIQDGQEESNFIHQKMVEIFCNLDLKDVATIKYKSLKDKIDNILNRTKSQHYFNLWKKKEIYNS